MTTLPPVARSIAALRAALQPVRSAGRPIGLIPTMGALHEGHLALVRAAKERGALAVVSIFVNPAQFAPTEDFSRYPRDEAGDLAKLASVATDLVYAPDVSEVYADGFSTTISMKGPALGLETDFRPHFFSGVATVVAKLLIAAMPDFAVFGEKDYQQLQVVRQLVGDLGLPMEIIGHPTVREPDGLALSSRNAYLSSEERAAAPAMHRALRALAARVRAGEPVEATSAEAAAALLAAGFRTVDYVAVRDAETLGEPGQAPLRALAAAWLGRTRLIDNIAV